MMIHPHQSCHQLGSYYVGDQLGHTYIILKPRVTFRTIPYQKRDAAIVNNITVGLPKERIHYTQQTSSNCGGITMALHFVSFRRFLFLNSREPSSASSLTFPPKKTTTVVYHKTIDTASCSMLKYLCSAADSVFD